MDAAPNVTQPKQFYEVRPRKDHRGVNLISDALPFGRLWHTEPGAISNATRYAKTAGRPDCAADEVKLAYAKTTKWVLQGQTSSRNLLSKTLEAL